MKSNWLVFLFLFLLCCGALAHPSSQQASSSPIATVSVRGTVVDSLTGKPLDSVHVMLTLYTEAEPSIVYGAMSNAQGRFSISDIPPGEYSLLPEKRGLIFVPDRKRISVRFDGSLPLRFNAGQHRNDLVLPMVARAIIAGRILDEHGDPLIDADVSAVSVNRDTSSSVRTNGRGEFRLSVPPGKYYVEGSKPSDLETTEDPNGFRPASGYVHTYYPGVARPEGASLVEAFAGRVFNGVEFRLVRPAAFRVSGEIIGVSDCGWPISLFWKPADTSKMGREGRESGRLDFTVQQADSDGAGSSVMFDSPPLDTGNYYFYGVCYSRNEQFQSQIAEVLLSDSDVTGITLALAPGAEITGTIAVTGEPVATPGQAIFLRLRSEGPAGFGSSLDAKMEENGSFRISNVFADRYRIEVGPLLEDAYIRTVDMNGSAVRGRLLDLRRGVEGVELRIVINSDGAQVTGQTREAKTGALVPQARVVLFPEREGLSVDEEECQTATAVDSVYIFKGLAPGPYRLVARPSYDEDECKHAATLMRQGLISAARVELNAGQKMMKNLQVVDEGRR